MKIFKLALLSLMFVTHASAADLEQRRAAAKQLDATLPGGAKVWVVDQHAEEGGDSPAGTVESPFRTIQAAADKTEAGDAVLVFAGVYRERVMPPTSGTADRPILYTVARGESVSVRGSELWQPQWTADEEHPDVFTGELDATWFEGIRNPYVTGISISGRDQKLVSRPVDAREAVWPRTLGQVFVDGEPYQEVEHPDELHRLPGTWLVDPKGQAISIHFADKETDPASVEVEVSVRSAVFAPRRRGLKHIHVRGFVFEHCSNQGPFPQRGMVSVRSGNSWVLENNVIRHSKTLGLDIGSEFWGVEDMDDTDDDQRKLMIGGKHQILNNDISDNGLCGVAGWNTSGLVLRGNRVERNNRLGFVAGMDARWWEQGGIKLHQANGAVIEGNLVRDNDAFGIWIDHGYRNARITRNVVVNNQLAGIFLELGAGPAMVDNNLVAYTRGGDGIYCHDAGGITVANNLCYFNANYGIWMHVVTDRKYKNKPVETSDITLSSNLLLGNIGGSICLPKTSSRAQNNRSDFNVFLDGSWLMTNKPARFRINSNSGRVDLGLNESSAEGSSDAVSSPYRLLTLEQWQQQTGFDAHSQPLAMGEKSKTMLREDRLHLEFTLEELPVVRGLDVYESAPYDLLGERYRGGKVLAGPFQGLREGRNSLYLWPLPEIQQD